MPFLQVRKKADISKAIKQHHEIINYSAHHRNRFANHCNDAKYRAGKIHYFVYQCLHLEAGYAYSLLGSIIYFRPDTWKTEQSKTHL